MKLTNFQTKRDSQRTVFSADYISKQNNLHQTVWFEIPTKFAASEFPLDAFIVSAYPIAVHLRETLEIDGSISRKLLRNLPKLPPKIGLIADAVEIRARSIEERAQRGKGTGQLFTLGIDSFYTLLKWREEHPRSSHFLIFVNGYDIQAVSKNLLETTNAEIQATAEYFNAQAVIINTNLRSVSEPIVDWGKYHGAAIAAAGHLLVDQIHSLFFNSSTIHREKIAWGTSKIADALWSTESVECLPFGTDAIRLKKVRTVAESKHFPFVKHRLRVCWENYGQPDAAFNCSRCEKCLRTQISIRFFTDAELPTFGPLDLGCLEDFHIKENDKHHWQMIYQQALRFLGTESEVTLAIKKLLAKNRIPEKHGAKNSGWKDRLARILHRK